MKKITYTLIIICGTLLNFESNGKNYEPSPLSSSDYYSSADFRSDFAKFSKNLEELKKIKADLDNMRFSQKINELIKCLTKISNILSDINRRQNQIQTNGTSEGEKIDKNQRSYYANQTSVEIFEKDLRGFNSALQSRETRFNTILNKGNKIFDNKENARLFAPGKKISSDLKRLFEQIHNTRYPEALSAWSEIKNTPITDKKLDEKLNNFRKKVGLLYRDVQKIKPLTKSNKNSTVKYVDR